MELQYQEGHPECLTFATKYSCTFCCFPTPPFVFDGIVPLCHQRCYGWLGQLDRHPDGFFVQRPRELGPFTCWGGKRDHIFVIRQLIVIFLLMALFLCDIIIISCSRVHSLLQHSGPSCPPAHSIQDSRKHRLQTEIALPGSRNCWVGTLTAEKIWIIFWKSIYARVSIRHPAASTV